MIVKTRSLTESLEKLYEAYEVETDDELDAIMDDDTLSDEEKEAEIGRVLDKHDKLNEAENPENAEINSVIRRTVGKKNISKKDAQALADAGIERDEYGDLTGKNGRRLVKSGTAIHGPGKTYHKYGKTDYRKGYDGKTTRWDLRKNSADMVGAKHADKWDKVDLKNYLDSEQPHSEWETEQESNKKLRPYSDKYQEYKRQKDSASWGVDRANRNIKSEEEIERMVQEYRNNLLRQRQHDLEWAANREGSKEYYDKQIKDIQAQAKAKHPQYESLNEAQLNENPLIAAAARAAIPAAIDVASNAISSAIDAKLHDGNNLEEDFWDPGEEFQNFEYLLYDEFDESGWNEWDQIQRDAFAEKVAKRYLELNPTPTPMFYQDLTDNNFHTYRKAFERLLGGNLTEAEGSDNELSFDEIMAKEKTSGNMDWYKKDKPNWKQVTEEE